MDDEDNNDNDEDMPSYPPAADHAQHGNAPELLKRIQMQVIKKDPKIFLNLILVYIFYICQYMNS